jgi:transposase
MDTAKKSIQVAMLLPERDKPIEWEVANDARGLKRLKRKLQQDCVGELRVCYEAGPCGYALQRDLRWASIDCIVIAPSLVPVKPGERIKTNRRDAKKLAQQFRAGTLTEVHPPTLEEEGVRDLCRCREDIREDLTRSRHRLGKMLLRRSLIFSGKAWTRAHREWLRALKFEGEADRAVFDDYLRAVELLEDRLATIEQKLEEVAQRGSWAEPVAWLRCFRGIDTVTAISIVAEVHGFARFTSARHLMSYLGLVPSESSTGEKHRRGRITRSGNAHVRRLLVEASWHYRHKPATGAKLRKRREGQPGWVIAAADKAQARLHRRYLKLVLGGKSHNKAVIAIARELAGFIWATLYKRESTVINEPRPASVVDRRPASRTRG